VSSNAVQVVVNLPCPRYVVLLSLAPLTASTLSSQDQLVLTTHLLLTTLTRSVIKTNLPLTTHYFYLLLTTYYLLLTTYY